MGAWEVQNASVLGRSIACVTRVSSRDAGVRAAPSEASLQNPTHRWAHKFRAAERVSSLRVLHAGDTRLYVTAEGIGEAASSFESSPGTMSSRRPHCPFCERTNDESTVARSGVLAGASLALGTGSERVSCAPASSHEIESKAAYAKEALVAVESSGVQMSAGGHAA